MSNNNNSNKIAQFGNVIVDKTKNGNARIQMIDLGKQTGVFLNMIYLQDYKKAGVQLNDLLNAISTAWNYEKPEKQSTPNVNVSTAAPNPTPTPNRPANLDPNLATAAGMCLELYNQGNKDDARKLAENAGIVSTPQGRGWDKLVEEWQKLAGKYTPSVIPAPTPAPSATPANGVDPNLVAAVVAALGQLQK